MKDDKTSVKKVPTENRDQELDFWGMMGAMWGRRLFLLKVTAVFMVLGLAWALFSPNEYRASCTVVLQSSGSDLGGLAAIAGVNLRQPNATGILSPTVYSIIISSVPFQQELMNTPVIFQKIDRPVTLLDYFTDPAYRRFDLLATIKKYTIGLPGLIMGKGGEKLPATGNALGSTIYSLSEKEMRCVKTLRKRTELNLNSKDGYITIAATMPEAAAAAQVAERMYELLQKYVIMFKIEKVQSNLDFVQERHDEAKKEFEETQTERAKFMDANRNISSATARAESERLDTRYNLALSLYTDLARQLEQAKINVKETTPALTVINPVTVPTERSEPRRVMIIIVFSIVGLLMGMLIVMGKPFVREINRRMRNISDKKIPVKD